MTVRDDTAQRLSCSALKSCSSPKLCEPPSRSDAMTLWISPCAHTRHTHSRSAVHRRRGRRVASWGLPARACVCLRQLGRGLLHLLGFARISDVCVRACVYLNAVDSVGGHAAATPPGQHLSLFCARVRAAGGWLPSGAPAAPTQSGRLRRGSRLSSWRRPVRYHPLRLRGVTSEAPLGLAADPAAAAVEEKHQTERWTARWRRVSVPAVPLPKKQCKSAPCTV